jgi:hypothetical protein
MIYKPGMGTDREDKRFIPGSRDHLVPAFEGKVNSNRWDPAPYLAMEEIQLSRDRKAKVL